MGSSSSKAARTAASATRRKYPQQASPATTKTPPRPPPAGGPAGPIVHPQPKASDTRDESINLDASDPQFAASLRSLGPVTPSSTLSNSSHFSPFPSSAPLANPSNPNQQIFPDPSQNPAILVLTARENLAKEAETEFARVRYEGGGGRRFLDVMTLRQVLMMRDQQQMTDSDIEQKLGLAGGVVKRLGKKGVFEEAGMEVG